MSTHSLTPVDASDRTRGVRVDLRSRKELLAEIRRLEVQADVWHDAWCRAVNARIETQGRLNRAMRVLASLARLSPRMAVWVEAARHEVYGKLP